MKTYTTPAIETVSLSVGHNIMLDGTLSMNNMNQKPMEDVGGDEANVSPIWDES